MAFKYATKSDVRSRRRRARAYARGVALVYMNSVQHSERGRAAYNYYLSRTTQYEDAETALHAFYRLATGRKKK